MSTTTPILYQVSNSEEKDEENSLSEGFRPKGTDDTFRRGVRPILEQILIAIASLLIVVFMSILVTRIATIALTHTGLTRASAKFQARSAFSGAGFTTRESEMVVNHPVRRKIVMILILIGNAGLVAAVSSLILTFVQQGDSAGLPVRIVVLVGGIVLLWALASSKWVDRRLSMIIDRLLKRYTDLNVTDYASLLHLTGNYRLAELKIGPKDWLNGKTLGETGLRKEGINVLGVRRPKGVYNGNPTGETRLHKDDTLVLYGSIEVIKELDRRERGHQGDWEHKHAVREQERVIEEEAMNEEAAGGQDNQTPER